MKFSKYLILIAIFLFTVFNVDAVTVPKDYIALNEVNVSFGGNVRAYSGGFNDADTGYFDYSWNRVPTFMPPDGHRAYCINPYQIYGEEKQVVDLTDPTRGISQTEVTKLALGIEKIRQDKGADGYLSLFYQDFYIYTRTMDMHINGNDYDLAYYSLSGNSSVSQAQAESYFSQVDTYVNNNYQNYKGYGKLYYNNGQDLISVWGEWQKGSLRILKKNARTGEAASGAVYELYPGAPSGNSCTGTKIGTLTTGSNGYSNTIENLAYGDYCLKEIKAPYGLTLDPNGVRVTISNADTKTETVTDTEIEPKKELNKTVSNLTAGGEVEFKITYANNNNVAGTVVVTDTITGGTYITGSASKAPDSTSTATTLKWTINNVPASSTGVITYKVKANNCAKQVCNSAVGRDTQEYTIGRVCVNIENWKKPIKVTKTNGYTNENMPNVLFDLYENAQCSGTPKATMQTNENGIVTFSGLTYPNAQAASKTYYIQETIPKGYYIKTGSTIYTGPNKGECIAVEVKKAGVEIPEATCNQAVNVPVTNTPYGNIVVLKQNSKTTLPIKGISFMVYEADGTTRAKDINGEELEEKTTNDKGVVEWENVPYGTYVLKETSHDGYKDGMYKTDGEDLELKESVTFELNKDTDAFKYQREGIQETEDEGIIKRDSVKLGDINNDGTIDKADLIILGKLVDGDEIEVDEDTLLKYMIAADVNNKGNCNNGSCTITEDDYEVLESYITTGVTRKGFEPLKEVYLSWSYPKKVTIAVTNVPIDIKISKMEVAKSKELPGAKIKITTKEGAVVEEWTSENVPHEFSLPAGEYVLTETVAPKGYRKIETAITFKVDTKGQVTILGAETNSAKVVKSSDGDLDHLIIYDLPDKVYVPDTGSVISVVGVLAGLSLIGYGGYTMYKKK